MPTEAPIEILFVEDDDDYLLAQKSLQRDRLLVKSHRVLDGVEALGRLRREPPYQDSTRPDLVLCQSDLSGSAKSAGVR